MIRLHSQGAVLLRPDGRYSLGFDATGNWVRSGNLIVLKSDIMPGVISGLELLESKSCDESTQTIITSYQRTGSSPHEYFLLLSNGSMDTTIQASTEMVNINKSFGYSTIMVIIPIPFETLKYSISDIYSLSNSDTVKVMVDGRGIELDYPFFDNKAFIKQGEYWFPVISDY